MTDFEELDFAATPMGELSLRRRAEPRLGGTIVYEVKLGDEFLMSSLFTAGEKALATLALEGFPEAGADVVVGGLGLGYTACAALEHRALRSLLVIERLAPVIRWHREGLVPIGDRVTSDERCRVIEADFFALAADAAIGFDPDAPERRFHAVLLDIDHSPHHLLSAGHAALYEAEGLATLARSLTRDGVFALWSNDPPHESFRMRLEAVFTTARAERVRFPNPYTGAVSSSTVYLARAPRA